jgi:hypothetical protein
MIADSYAAMNPPDTLWRKYLAEAARLKSTGDVSESEFALLRFSMEARDALMTVTRGDAELFAEGTVAEVLAMAKRNAASDAERAGREAAVAEQRARFREIAAGLAGVVSTALLSLAVTGLVVGLTAASAGLDTGGSTLIRALVSACVLFGAAFGVSHAIVGLSLVDIARRLRAWMTRSLEAALVARLAPRVISRGAAPTNANE